MIRFLEREIQPVLFKDRIDAGRQLGERLKNYQYQNPVVLAIPAGGVPVGLEVAKILGCPLDLILVRKIQFPWTTEAGFGAIASDGTLFLGRQTQELPREVIEKQTKKALKEVKHRWWWLQDLSKRKILKKLLWLLPPLQPEQLSS
jgi:predicted phosphoribosyltransferase